VLLAAEELFRRAWPCPGMLAALVSIAAVLPRRRFYVVLLQICSISGEPSRAHASTHSTEPRGWLLRWLRANARWITNVLPPVLACVWLIKTLLWM
jgi:hypothetical protein